MRIPELPTDTVVQLIRADVCLTEVLGSNPGGDAFFACSVTFFLLYYTDESLERPILTWV